MTLIPKLIKNSRATYFKNHHRETVKEVNWKICSEKNLCHFELYFLQEIAVLKSFLKHFDKNSDRCFVLRTGKFSYLILKQN